MRCEGRVLEVGGEEGATVDVGGGCDASGPYVMLGTFDGFANDEDVKLTPAEAETVAQWLMEFAGAARELGEE